MHSVRVGLQAIGIGPGARPGVVVEAARAAEAVGFATLWMGEHVVLFDSHTSTYPYSEGGEFPVGADTDWLDPLVSLGFAAALTRRIRLATGILLVPEHNPLILAKQVSTLDRLSGGRFALGVGVGWLAEEFAALGVPFARRAMRTREYVEAMREVWRADVASYRGEFVEFDAVRSAPRPAAGRVPVLLGGESRPALERAAAYGDGWYGFNLGPDEAAEKIGVLTTLLSERGRDRTGFEIVVAPFMKAATPGDVASYHALGVNELVVVATPPEDGSRVAAWVQALAEKWVAAAAAMG
jgi:probable F420-dependent oxidoreductase